MSPLPTILLVDDLAANRDTLRELLHKTNYEFIEAPDGPLALALASADPPDLVLLDVLMPGMDGFEVCRRLRADPRMAEVPVIMVTALDDRTSRIAGIEAGADDFVSKPIDPVELCARVRTITRLNRYGRLVEEQRQFHWVVEHARDGYLLVDAFDVILFANARARLWLGLPADHLTRATETFFGVASRSFLRQPAESWQSWPAIPPLERALPRLLVRPETTRAHAQVLDVTVHENTGTRLLRICDVFGHIAARRNHRSLQAMVQHKLRTPLNGIVGPLALLALDGVDGDQAQRGTLIALVRTSVARLDSAVEDVTRYAEASQSAPPGATCPAVALVEAAGRVAEGLGLTAVTVRIGESTSLRNFPCNHETLEWLLCELLENSRKFHPLHSPTVEIVVDSAPGAGIVLSIRDDGLALSLQEVAEMGRPFFQGEKNFSGETPGMGLGLASVFALVWQTGGTCLVQNRPDGPGLCVELRWPRAPGDGVHGPIYPAPPSLADSIPL